MQLTETPLVTLDDLLNQASNNKAIEPVIGQTYFFFTGTFGFIGRLTSFDNHRLSLSELVWVAHASNVQQFALSGQVSVAAPMLTNGFMFWNSIICMMEWNHPLPSLII